MKLKHHFHFCSYERLWIILSLCLFGLADSMIAQVQEFSTNYYLSTGNYMDGKSSDEKVLILFRSMSDEYIYVKDILDPQTRKKSKDGNRAWGITYEGNDYINLKYSNNAYAQNLFVRIDIKGRFCLAVMEPEFAEVLDKGAGKSNAKIGGMTHTFDSAIGGIFLDQEGHKRQIFIIDTKDLSIVLPYKANNAPIDLLQKSTLKWLVGKENYEGSLKEYTAEEIIAIVEDLNSRQER